MSTIAENKNDRRILDYYTKASGNVLPGVNTDREFKKKKQSSGDIAFYELVETAYNLGFWFFCASPYRKIWKAKVT